MDALLNPRSIAVIGASADESKIGGKIIPAILRGDFGGGLYAVNPGRSSIHGVPCVPSIEDIEAPVDLAVVAVPSNGVEQAVESCVRKAVRSIAVYTGGFGEAGPAGRAKEDFLRDVARRTGIRILGPNCQGFLVPSRKLCTTFNGVLARHDNRTPGGVAWIAQSGAIGGIAVSLLRRYGLGISFWVSTGNECDVDFCALAEYALDDPETSVICGYVESIKHVARFRAIAARALAQGKPIILVKGGQSAPGAAAAQSHTGAIVGDHRIMSGLFRQCGVVAVASLEELAATAAFFHAYPAPDLGPAIGILGNSGGTGVLLADQGEALGLRLPAVSPDAVRRLRQVLPDFITPSNPVDIPMQIRYDPAVLRHCVEGLGGQPDQPDAYLVCLHSIYAEDGYDVEGVVRELAAAQKAVRAPVLVVPYGSDAQLADLARAHGIGAFHDGPLALKALSHASWWAGVRRSVEAGGAQGGEAVGPPLAKPTRSGDGSGPVTEDQLKALLRGHGIDVPDGAVVTSSEAAVAAADRLGYPVVAKLVHPHIAHKTDVGAVLLSLADAGQVAAAYESLARIPADGGAVEVLVEAMAPAGRDLIVGARRVPDLGWVLMLGIGGIAVEALDDIAARPMPVTADDVTRMVGELKLRGVLDSGRGEARPDLPWLASFVEDLHQFVSRCDWLDEVELNPVRLFPEGSGGLVLDALATTASVRPAPALTTSER